MNHQRRVSELRARFGESGLDGFVVTHLPNVRYLTGFTGSSGSVLVGPHEVVFFTDGRYKIQSAEQVVGARIQIFSQGSSFAASLDEVVGSQGMRRVGIEQATLTLKAFEEMGGDLKDCELVPTDGWVESVRRIKEPEEINLIRQAAKITDDCFSYIVDKLDLGKTEKQMALDLEVFMRGHGAEGVSFEPIVASGPQSALPHARPSDRKIEKGDFLLFDMGCKVMGYCSDMTRTVAIGPADDRQREVYDAVLEAQMKGLEAVKPGATGGSADGAARSILSAKGFGEAFGHSLGHGVGLDIHEAPTLRAAGQDVLAAGHVVTVEPGAYFEGWGGVRIEDLVVVTNEGPDVLSTSSKELIEL